MDVISVILNGFSSSINNSCLSGKTCSCDDIIVRDVNIHAIDAKVGIELRVTVILMEIPAFLCSSACTRRFINADLWEPLPCHNEIAVFTHAGKYFGQLNREINFQCNALAPANRDRKTHLG
ncbi:hypothetical protein D3C76_1335630 [compost metagenome]